MLQRALGPRRALLRRAEIKLLADLVYYTQTMTGGTGTTLGEEYCSVLRRVPGEGRVRDVLNWVLAVLQGVQPYLEEKRRAWEEARERAELTRSFDFGSGLSLGPSAALDGAPPVPALRPLGSGGMTRMGSAGYSPAAGVGGAGG